MTCNLKDFPSDRLRKWGIEAQRPDTFLTRQLSLSPSAFLQAVKTTRLRLKRPPKSAESYLDTLRAQGLATTADELASFERTI